MLGGKGSAPLDNFKKSVEGRQLDDATPARANGPWPYVPPSVLGRSQVGHCVFHVVLKKSMTHIQPLSDLPPRVVRLCRIVKPRGKTFPTPGQVQPWLVFILVNEFYLGMALINCVAKDVAALSPVHTSIQDTVDNRHSFRRCYCDMISLK